ncbi:hypothetical protein ACFIQF_11555 [Comamonas sp. J-3]|uniref:hypothetical protein n=1 Tax=Comamonas trifloxystrobinivorans TaxID=3350256 RepID=UPI0037283D71
MMTSTNQRERLTHLARSRRPAALAAKAELPSLELCSLRLFASEMAEADQLASAMCWKRGFLLRTVFLMGWQLLLAQPDRLQFFYASGVAARPAAETVPVPRVLAGLRLYPTEKQTAADFAASLGLGHTAPFLRFVYLLGLRQYKAQRDQVQFFGRDGMVQPGLATAAAAAA